MEQITIGIIGGSGLYEIEDLQNIKETQIDTPFGKPSGSYVQGELEGVKLIFLPRHGVGHFYSPSEINYRANIYGFKKLGVELLVSISAVGSMKENIVPGDFVIVDQFIDRTKYRTSTFFEGGCVAHIGFADPVCSSLRSILTSSCQSVGIKTHEKGTYVCIEGPQFSTRAESTLFRSWGVDVIGMTNLPEARLAREAELCYATVALATDFDCWHEAHDDVDAESVLKVVKNNVGNAKKVIKEIVKKISSKQKCSCPDALRFAIVTRQDKIPEQTKKNLTLLIDKYI